LLLLGSARNNRSQGAALWLRNQLGTHRSWTIRRNASRPVGRTKSLKESAGYDEEVFGVWLCAPAAAEKRASTAQAITVAAAARFVDGMRNFEFIRSITFAGSPSLQIAPQLSFAAALRQAEVRRKCGNDNGVSRRYAAPIMPAFGTVPKVTSSNSGDMR
jgi:hypothetical protein